MVNTLHPRCQSTQELCDAAKDAEITLKLTKKKTVTTEAALETSKTKRAETALEPKKIKAVPEAQELKKTPTTTVTMKDASTQTPHYWMGMLTRKLNPRQLWNTSKYKGRRNQYEQTEKKPTRNRPTQVKLEEVPQLRELETEGVDDFPNGEEVQG